MRIWVWQIVLSKDDCKHTSYPIHSSAEWPCQSSIRKWSVFPLSLESLQALWLLWPIEYSTSDVVPVLGIALNLPGNFSSSLVEASIMQVVWLPQDYSAVRGPSHMENSLMMRCCMERQRERGKVKNTEMLVTLVISHLEVNPLTSVTPAGDTWIRDETRSQVLSRSPTHKIMSKME